jgi:hypothetical protein
MAILHLPKLAESPKAISARGKTLLFRDLICVRGSLISLLIRKIENQIEQLIGKSGVSYNGLEAPG